MGEAIPALRHTCGWIQRDERAHHGKAFSNEACPGPETGVAREKNRAKQKTRASILIQSETDRELALIGKH